MVQPLNYREMPTATRDALLAALDPTATMHQSDLLAQLERLDSRDREQRMVDMTASMERMTAEMRTWTKVAALAAIVALVVSALSLLT